MRKNIGKQLHLQCLQKIQYLGINSTKQTKDLFNENSKPLKKEVEEDYRR
jgi:hypothetical protein